MMEMDGRKRPATIAPKVPIESIMLSFLELYWKNLWNEMVVELEVLLFSSYSGSFTFFSGIGMAVLNNESALLTVFLRDVSTHV